MKGGSGEKIAMTSPVATDMDGAKYDHTFCCDCASYFFYILTPCVTPKKVFRDNELPSNTWVLGEFAGTWCLL